MKQPWLAYVVVAVLAAGAGVAIAGLPDRTPVGATIATPATTDVSASTMPEPTDTTEPTQTTEPDDTTPETTEPEATPPDTTEPEDTTPETTEAAGELPDRADIEVVAANGANVAGAAQRMVDRLEFIGYADVLPLNGTDLIEFTVVFYADGFEDAARRMAEDLELFPDFVAPLDEAPTVPDLPDTVELLVYIGPDRA